MSIGGVKGEGIGGCLGWSRGTDGWDGDVKCYELGLSGDGNGVCGGGRGGEG